MIIDSREHNKNAGGAAANLKTEIWSAEMREPPLSEAVGDDEREGVSPIQGQYALRYRPLLEGSRLVIWGVR
ncbi:hypothetical protein C3Y89_01350 [Rhizobium sp. UPM1132]|nr:hypothetical protein [Rhizobium ruizarguesonis]